MENSYQIVKKIRDAVIVQLRDAFTQDERYTYNEDSLLTKIMIHDVSANETLKIPSIIINTLSGEESRYLQNDLVQETATGFTRGSGINSSTSIEVLTLDTISRDEIVDRIYQLLKDMTDTLADYGVGILKTNFNPERRQFVGDRWWYTSGVTLSCYSEWLEVNTTSPTTGYVTSISFTGTIGFIGEDQYIGSDQLVTTPITITIYESGGPTVVSILNSITTLTVTITDKDGGSLAALKINTVITPTLTI